MNEGMRARKSYHKQAGDCPVCGGALLPGETCEGCGYSTQSIGAKAVHGFHVSLSVRGAIDMSWEEKRRFMGSVLVDGEPVRTVEDLDMVMRQLLEEGTECLQMSDECTTHDPINGCQCMKLSNEAQGGNHG